MDIKKISALVTGGASGLGAACAQMLTAAGAHVTLLDLAEEKGQAFAKALGPLAYFLRTDVTSEADLSVAIEDHLKRTGALNALINCAGVATPFKVLNKEGEPRPLHDFAKVLQINLFGTFNVLRLAVAAMAKQSPNADGERGVIINTASVAAFDGQVGQAAYSASKGAVAAMTLPLAREFAPLGIRVMTIAPGIFETPMMAGLPEKARLSLAEQVPFPPRLGRPEEYALLCRQIIENPMLNGEVIRLDGALRMGSR